MLEIDRYTNQPGFQDVSSDLVSQILEEGAKFADEVIAPINNPGDKEGCHWAEGGVVTGPKGWKEAYKAMSEAGWMALAADPALQCERLALAVAQCIEQDGAQAVVIGGGPLSEAALWLAPRFAQPVLSPVVAAMQAALASLSEAVPQ